MTYDPAPIMALHAKASIWRCTSEQEWRHATDDFSVAAFTEVPKLYAALTAARGTADAEFKAKLRLRDMMTEENTKLATELTAAQKEIFMLAASGHELSEHLRQRGEALTAARAENERLREALAIEMAWHKSENKALSKSGRKDTDCRWRTSQHLERIAEISEVLSDEEYEAAFDRINARAALNAVEETNE